MKKINLRDLYFYINKDYEIEVSDEVYEVFDLYRKMEARYHSKRRYNNINERRREYANKR